MIRPLMILNVVGLTYDALGPHTPHLTALAKRGFARPLEPILPAVTCSAQATLLTGTLPSQHGIVANGWYMRDLAEVGFWKQSNHLIQGETLYQAASRRDAGHTTAKMFWWYNMYAPVAYSMTPRPSYPANGRKVFDSYSQPPELKNELQAELGVFPLPRFWGPIAGIESSAWIADATLRVLAKHHPSLTLVYLPHLDYNLQRLGPNDPRIAADMRLVDAEAGKLIGAADAAGADVLVVSEYGISAVSQPVHINRVLREHGYLQVRNEALGWETLDCGASKAFAVSDHQVAHIYVQKAGDIGPVKSLLERVPGIERVLSGDQIVAAGLGHERSGELVAVSTSEAWFTYYFWLDDRQAPDYARTIDIHRKPGYDPVELFVDPKLWFPKGRMAVRLTQKLLGFRYYMDLIGLDATIVKGSHGRLPDAARLATDGAVIISSRKDCEPDKISTTDVKQLALEMQFGRA